LQPQTTFWKWQVCLTDRPQRSTVFVKRIQIASYGGFLESFNCRETEMDFPFKASAATKE